MDPLGSSSNNQKYKIQEKRIQYYEARMMQQIIAYLSFQCIILAWISQSQANRVRCKHWWIPFTLSLLSALYFAIHIYDTFYEYLTAHRHLHHHIHQLLQSSPQSEAVDHVVVDVSPSEEEGTSPSTPENNSTESAPATLQNVPQPIHQEIKMLRQNMLVSSTLVFTAAVTILVCLACYFVLCDGSETMEKTC